MISLLLKQSILQTLLYADLFSWPLTEKEVFAKMQNSKCKIKNYNVKLKNKRKRTSSEVGPIKSDTPRMVVSGAKIDFFKRAIRELMIKGKINKKNSFYFLPKMENIVLQRLQKEKWAKEKIKLANKAAGWLKIIPSILLVGVSGGLAIGNVKAEDDIDFFIICQNGTLWMTRFLTIGLLEILGVRRRPGDKDIKDKICLNMFVDEVGMEVPGKERDLFTAHEVVQMRPLWDRKGIYGRFLEANRWVKDCLPNLKVKIKNSKLQLKIQKFNKENFAFYILHFAFSLVEPILSLLQKKYMNSKRTGEKIESHRLLFHPEDKREMIMRNYRKRLKSLKIT